MALQRLIRALVYLFLCVWGFVSIYPILWMFGASLKESADVMNGYAIFPKGAWHWETFADVWNRLHFFKYFINSVSVTFFTLAGIVLIYSMTAFALAKLHFRGKQLIFFGFLGMMFVPGITVLIPLYLTEHYLGILDTHLGIILPIINGAAPFTIFLLRNYYRTIPHELFESAKLDGAGVLRILYFIYMPLSFPALATILIINFFSTWNTFALPMVVLNDQSKYTLPLAVMMLDTGVFRQWNVLMAGSLISMIPVIMTLFSLQKYYVQGLSAGAVKV